MRILIVLALCLTPGYNQGFQSGRPLDIFENLGLPLESQNPRIRRSPNPYYGLYNYIRSSPYLNRQAAMNRRVGMARGLLRHPQQPARPSPDRAQVPASPVQAPASQRVQAPAPQRVQAPAPQRVQAPVPQRVQAPVPQRVNPYGFGRTYGMLNALHAQRDRSRIGRVDDPYGIHGVVGRNQDRSRRVDGIRGIGLGAGLYRAMSGSGWKSYGGSSGGKGSYYYRHSGSSGGGHGGHGGHYGGSYRGSYYHRGGGGGGHGHGYGHGNSYWRRR